MPDLLDDATLAQSSVVANSTMNRERVCVGANSYARDAGLSPLDFLRERLQTQDETSWLDLCCGAGKALIEAGETLETEGHASRVRLVGVDLVPLFDPRAGTISNLRLHVASLADWQPDRPFDLITCVHGLHYIGDKLDLITRATSWLTETGLFLASFDPPSIRDTDSNSLERSVLKDLRASGLVYQPRKRLLACNGRRVFELPYTYLGADDRAGPNYTGQAAVHSYYKREETC